MNDNIFEYLNEKQISAVKATEGKIRVIAGAGSGKTRVLACRYAYLVECLGIDSANILCMTFTNKAAQEMRNRIKKLTKVDVVNDFICTIHGLCVKILRKEIYRLGYPSNFLILDIEDSKTLVKQVMDELGLKRTAVTEKQILNDINEQKARFLRTYYVHYLLPNTDSWEELDSSFGRFLQLQRKYYALDFNDLLFFTLYILNEFPDALDYWQNQFDYIQVDEVQDCNLSDWEIINTLSNKCGNLFIVGDPDQAIYEWRGAKPNLFIYFEADSDIILDENYRSTPNILNVANSIIKNNKNRIKKNLRTRIPADAIAIHKHAKNEEEEGMWIADLIKKMMKNGKKPDDFAILYRASYQSRFIEQSLMRKSLPYTIWGGIRFFERKEIKDCLAYLRLIQAKDDISFRRIINVPSRKFGKAKLSALEELAKSEQLSLYETLKAHINEPPFNVENFRMFIMLIEHLSAKVLDISISDLMERILNDTGLTNLYRMDGDEDRLENIQELMNSIRSYEMNNTNEEINLETYLQDVALFTNTDFKNDDGSIKLMTIHQSKGLEFPFVFVIGLTEGIFPSYRTIRERKDEGLEEERRLMYVAVTRAENALFLTESEGYNYATHSDKFPSRFITEISDNLLKVDGNIDSSLILERNEMIISLKDEIEEFNDIFKEGDLVEHEIFGIGKILSINKERKSYEVDFNGKKKNIHWNFLNR